MQEEKGEAWGESGRGLPELEEGRAGNSWGRRVDGKDLGQGGQRQDQAQGSYIVTAILLATLLLSIQVCYPLVTSRRARLLQNRSPDKNWMLNVFAMSTSLVPETYEGFGEVTQWVK